VIVVVNWTRLEKCRSLNDWQKRNTRRRRKESRLTESRGERARSCLWKKKKRKKVCSKEDQFNTR